MQQNSYSQPVETEYKSVVPGRVRVKIETTISNGQLIIDLINILANTPGITFVSYSSYTSKLLILYDINKVAFKEIKDKISAVLNGGDLINSKNANIRINNLIVADFRNKRVLTPEEFISSRNVLSRGYYDYNINALLPGLDMGSAQAPWHTKNLEQIEQELDTDLQNGLHIREVERRIKQYGLNQLYKSRKKSLVSMLFNHFDSFSIRLLLAASGLSLLLGQVADSVTILAIIAVEAMIGAWQEYKAANSLEDLKELTASHADVIRNGKIFEIASTHIVPGDIICLEAGDIIPADARLVQCMNLQVTESSLTGESSAVLKQAEDIPDANIPLGDRTNMVYMGTSVVRGKGTAVVIGTGMNTESGKIAGMLKSVSRAKSPLQKDLDRLAKTISFGCLGICAVITAGGIIGGQPFLDMLSTGVSLAVGAIPEGLTTVLAISLAFGAQRMARKNAIVKSLPSVETLSCTKVICTDKTGTLTKNELTVRSLYTLKKSINVTGEGYNSHGNFLIDGKRFIADGHEDVIMLLTASVLCNNSQIKHIRNGYYSIKGDPTEAALLIAGEKSGLRFDSFNCYKRENEIPFDSETKKMTAVCSDKDGKYFSFSKGALDIILKKCKLVMKDSLAENITQTDIDQIFSVNEEMAGKGLRVLAFSYKPLGSKPKNMVGPEVEEDMVLLGLIGMMDPPRVEVAQAIKKCHNAGIKVVMVTGDHKKTAAAIAKSINLLTGDGIVLSGDELDAMSEGQLISIIDSVQVFARTCPEQKLKIVRAFRKKGFIVAMTGDGINDAPALKEADIGIAMGQAGADVAKDASSIILTDDNFSTIVKAVEEGRTINRNIRTFIKYVLSGNFAEVLAIFLASVSGLPSPLLPIHILMLNLVTEGIPALSLGVDPPQKDIMNESPVDPSTSVLSPGLMRRIIIRGTATGLSTLGVFCGTMAFTGNLAMAQTMAFVNLVSCQMLHAFECSSMGVARNKYLFPSVAISTGIMLACVYFPPLNSVFSLVPLNIAGWAVILLSAVILSRIEDFLKDTLYLPRLRQTPSLGV